MSRAEALLAQPTGGFSGPAGNVDQEPIRLDTLCPQIRELGRCRNLEHFEQLAQDFLAVRIPSTD